MDCANCGHELLPGYPPGKARIVPGYTGYLDFYNMDAKQICMACWAEMHRDRGKNNQRRVAATQIGDIAVSTVLLGTNHNWLGEGPPIIFETMIFDKEGSVGDYQERYATKQAALAGHDRAVQFVKEHLVMSDKDVNELFRLR
jgi:hypothetical protein